MLKKACKWSLTLSLLLSLLDDWQDKIFNRMFHLDDCSCRLLPPGWTYNFHSRINSAAIPLVRTVLHKNSFVMRTLSQFGVG